MLHFFLDTKFHRKIQWMKREFHIEFLEKNDIQESHSQIRKKFNVAFTSQELNFFLNLSSFEIF